MKTYYIPSTFDRIFARLIDAVGEFILMSPVLMKTSFNGFSIEGLKLHWLQLVYIVFVRLGYEFVSVFLFDTTPGKWVMGLKIVPARDHGQGLGWQDVLSRVLICRLSLFFSWAIYALMFFRYDRTHLADWVAGTRVVSDRPRRNHAEVRILQGALLICLYLDAGITNAIEMASSVHVENGQVLFLNR